MWTFWLNYIKWKTSISFWHVEKMLFDSVKIINSRSKQIKNNIKHIAGFIVLRKKSNQNLNNFMSRNFFFKHVLFFRQILKLITK